MTEQSIIQISIIAAYFAITVAVGLWTMRKSKNSASFHGAELAIFAIVAASAGEWLGGTATTGVSEYGFLHGLSGSWYTIANGIGIMFLALCFAKLYRSLNSVTVPGIIENFFGVKARTVSSILLTIVMLAVGLSQMIAAGKLGETLFSAPVGQLGKMIAGAQLIKADELTKSSNTVRLGAILSEDEQVTLYELLDDGSFTKPDELYASPQYNALSGNLSESENKELKDLLSKAPEGFVFSFTVIAFAIIFIIYTLAGGMNAVASTNKIHLFAMYGGVIIAIIFSLIKLGGIGAFRDGIAQVEAAAAQSGETKSYFNMFSIGLPTVISWIIASLLGACTAQAGVQPILASKDVPSAKKACFISAFVVAPFGIFTALLGMMAKVLSHNGALMDSAGSNVTDAKLALTSLMINLPDVVGGIVLASILAAITSTVSQLILASGTMFTKDIYQRVLKPDASDKQVLFISRASTAISGIICCVFAILLVNASSVLGIVYAAYSLRGAIFVVVLFGIYWKRASERAACWSMVLTGVAAVTWKVADLVTGHYPISDAITETYVAVGVALVATVLLSLVFPKKTFKMA